ncbi:hypothetical protein [Natrinema halophilum]|uniref:Uncharacterized protein n=1 Tax=Natrinema halophilum TaxID=1699371 RepID=A0A7D5GIG6_9EURY|nr:hypothetical protein [Natrinema halophilum]QLG49687.1 hypothetical protein HYG82_12855 [Natrinema halophilum]
MANDNSHRLSRRNVIRSTAGLSSLGITSLLASGTGAAQSGTRRGKYGYGIDDSGYLVYYGDDDDSMIASTEAMNEAKDEGKLDFSMQNGAVTIDSKIESQTQPNTNGVRTARYRAPPSETCNGKTEYGVFHTPSGIRHKLWINHCDCRDLVDLLSIGIELAAFSAAVNGLYGNIPAVVVSAAAGFLMRIGKSLINNNDEGHGIVLAVTTYRLTGGVTAGGLEPQH